MPVRRVTSTTLALVSSGVVIAALVGLTRTTTAFNPQPEPPGFGLVTLVASQAIRINVVCSEHAAGDGSVRPGPCSGELMFHDAEGNVLSSREVSLRPGQAASLELDPVREAGGAVAIDPCWVPGLDRGGHAIPSAEVFNALTGETTLFLNPAVARLSDLDSWGRARP